MHLYTKIIAEKSPQLIKRLHCSFDHNFQIVSAKITSNNYLTSQKQCSTSISQNFIKSLFNIQSSKKQKPQCFITYNIPFKVAQIEEAANLVGQCWKVKIQQYNIKTGVMCEISTTQSQTVLANRFRIATDYIYILQLFYQQKSVSRIYFLGSQSSEQQIGQSRSIHESFKLLRVIKYYLSLDSYCEDSLLQDNICANLSQYLYIMEVNCVTILLRLDGGQMDKKVLQQTGQIKLPEQWLQKQEYRSKKRQIYCLRRDQMQLLKHFKKIKSEMVNTINSVQKLAGLPEQKYENISIDSLKQLKAESLNQKVALVKQLDSLRLGLDIRLQQLENLKNQCQKKKNDIQKQHIQQLLALKKEVLVLQAEEPAPKYSGTQRLIYSRAKPAAVQNKLITTIFSHVNKKSELIEPQKEMTLKDNSKEVSNRFNSQVEKEKENTFRSHQYKYAEKRVASVIKEGVQMNQQLDIPKVREEYQNQTINIDFESQKKFLEKQMKYQKAAAALKRLMDGAEDMHFQSN